MENPKRRLRIDIADRITSLKDLIKEYTTKNRAYKTFFRGKSFDFESFRNYSSEDDALNIDWVASARYDKLLMKQFKEKERLTILFLVDTSENMVAGVGEKLKCEYAAELALSLAYIILSKDNRVGFILFNDKINTFFPPMGGDRCFHSFLDALSDADNYHGTSNINEAADFLLSLPTYRSASAIFISDFARFNEITMRKLTSVSFKFETSALIIRDQLDKQLPDISGEFALEDPSSGEQILIEPKLAKKSYEEYMKKYEEYVKKSLKTSKIDFLELNTNETSSDKLAIFLKEKIKNQGAWI
jgi:uncharacterized protein (DUF58 family)